MNEEFYNATLCILSYLFNYEKYYSIQEILFIWFILFIW